MNSIGGVVRKLGFLLRRERFNSELEEEMAFHRSLTERELCAEGLTPQSAHYAAKRQFGNGARLQEESREMVGFKMESVLRDARFAVRQLGRNPGFACTAILVLALGIGASVAIFGFVDAALIKPLPYKDSARLVGVFENVPLFPRSNLSYLDFVDWKKMNRVFSSFDAWSGSGFLLSTSAGVHAVTSVRVSDGFFRTLGVTPVIGRGFQPGEDQPNAPRVVMLSFAGWLKHFGGRPGIVGTAVTLSDAS
jgi:hypothetical protein